MKVIKTDSHASLSEDRLNSLIWIRSEGPKAEDFNPSPAIKLWASTSHRRPVQKKRKLYNKLTEKCARPRVLIDHPESEAESSTDESTDTEIDMIPKLQELD